MLKLIGSQASPYVRRIRLLLANQEYDFETVAVFTKEGQDRIKQFTTTGRIPILIDNETVVWDSNLITQYLLKEHFSLEIQKKLSLIDDLTDAGVQVFQLRHFEVDTEDKNQFSQNNLNRIQRILEYFNQEELTGWSIVEQWLFCTLDWFNLRKVIPWQSEFPNLAAFHQENTARSEIVATAVKQ